MVVRYGQASEFARGYCYDVACKISKQIKKPQVEVVVLREKNIMKDNKDDIGWWLGLLLAVILFIVIFSEAF